MQKKRNARNHPHFSRRNFIKFGSIALAGSAVKFPKFSSSRFQEEESEPRISQFKILGRTGFRVSDISMGTGRFKDPNIVRYALDHGVNYLDTAESYGNGRSERLIGEAMANFDRKKIFITTKLHLKGTETKEEIKERFGKCLERMKTNYADALYLHSVPTAEMTKYKPFHDAADELQAEGKLRFRGCSNHGPRGKGESMSQVLCAAAEDGRFDLMLVSLNFMNDEEGKKVIAACKKNNVGVTAMKTKPGILAPPDFDPNNLTEDQQAYLKRIMKRGVSKEEAMRRLKNRYKTRQKTAEKSKPFIEKYGIKTKEELENKSIQWVISDPDIHTACISFTSFEMIDRIIPLSGTKLSAADRKFLDEIKYVYGDQYCRHGCNKCADFCPYGVPVNTIMRYAYYFEMQGSEKLAMEKYHRLGSQKAEYCFSCEGHCESACPYGVNIPIQLMTAHGLLTFA